MSRSLESDLAAFYDREAPRRAAMEIERFDTWGAPDLSDWVYQWAVLRAP